MTATLTEAVPLDLPPFHGLTVSEVASILAAAGAAAERIRPGSVRALRGWHPSGAWVTVGRDGTGRFDTYNPAFVLTGVAP